LFVENTFSPVVKVEFRLIYQFDPAGAPGFFEVAPSQRVALISVPLFRGVKEYLNQCDAPHDVGTPAGVVIFVASQ